MRCWLVETLVKPHLKVLILVSMSQNFMPQSEVLNSELLNCGCTKGNKSITIPNTLLQCYSPGCPLHVIMCFICSVPDPNAPNVQVTRMTLVCDAKSPLTLDLQGESLFETVHKVCCICSFQSFDKMKVKKEINAPQTILCYFR